MQMFNDVGHINCLGMVEITSGSRYGSSHRLPVNNLSVSSRTKVAIHENNHPC